MAFACSGAQELLERLYVYPTSAFWTLRKDGLTLFDGARVSLRPLDLGYTDCEMREDRRKGFLPESHWEKMNVMGLIELLLVVLLVVVLVGAFSGVGGGAYRTPGIGLGGILLIILLVLLLT